MSIVLRKQGQVQNLRLARWGDNGTRERERQVQNTSFQLPLYTLWKPVALPALPLSLNAHTTLPRGLGWERGEKVLQPRLHTPFTYAATKSVGTPFRFVLLLHRPLARGHLEVKVSQLTESSACPGKIEQLLSLFF